MEHQQVTTNGIRLHVVQAGPVDGPLVILLHGFPEFWYGWRRQIDDLAGAGYRVWAPDQRGYNLSDKPQGIGAYTIDILAADVVGLIDAAGQEQAVLVGHDWGAAVAWWVAAQYPERIKRLAVINVPHPTVMQQQLRGNWMQLLRSWYIFFFQLPWLPEQLAWRNNWRMAVQALTTSSRPGAFSADDLDLYRQAWSQPNAYQSMLNWYRAVLQKPPAPPTHPRITVPTLLIWGAQDKFLGQELAQPSIDLCEDGRLVLIPEATHWVQHEEADRVNELIATFLE
ncbi:MAG: alpha/beta hydrolase [Caldilineaceae bacterium]